MLFRVWDSVSGGSPVAIRVLAILFGGVAVVSVAYAVFAIAGQRAAAIAAVLVAVASANARIEGFIANGELLAGGASAAGVAVACAYLFRGRGRAWLFVGGVLAGSAMSFKQSGFDGFGAVMICLVAGGLAGEQKWRKVLRDGAVCVSGLACVLTALVVHGAFLGLGRWWYALAGYRLGGLNASDADWHRFGITARIAAPTIIPLGVAAVAGVVVWLARNRRLTRSIVLLPAWICLAVLAFLTGGLFHRHYWVTLTFPLAAAAAVALAKINGRALVAVTSLVAIPSLISTAQVIALDRNQVAIIADDDPRLRANEQVGDWYIQHRTPGSTLYAMCASAALYPRAKATPPYPYLWYDGVLHGKGSQIQLLRLFQGADPPTFVALYQDALPCNPTGQVAALLQKRYSQAAMVGGVSILVLNGSAAAGSVAG